ncbi:MAG: TonB-dependent receptor [Elusimicrobiota bacterium]
MIIIIFLSLLIIPNILVSEERTDEVFFSLERKIDDKKYSYLPYYGSYVEHYKSDGDVLKSIDDSASIFIKKTNENYGVSTLFIRGFSSNHSAVIYDDIKLPKDITGVYDMSLLPPLYNSEVYLLKGGWSALYGVDSSAGAIALKSLDIKENDQVALLKAEFGDYDTKRYSLVSGFSKDKFSIITSAENYFSDGFQENSTSNKNSLSIKISYDFGTFGKTVLSGFGVSLKTGIPSGTPYDISEFDGKKEKKANTPDDWMSNENVFLSARHTVKFEDGAINLSYARSNLIREAYQWSSLTKIKTFSDVFLLNGNFKNFGYGAEFQADYLRSNKYGNHSMKNIGYFINGKFNLSSKIDLFAYLRYDDSKAYSDVLSPKAIIRWVSENGSTIVSYSASKSWRSPTFADRYGNSSWGIPENPDIKPEKSVGNELNVKLIFDKIDFSIGGYYYDITDRIMLDSSQSYKAVNLAKGYVRGIDISASYSYHPFVISISNSYIKSMGKDVGEGSYKRMPYVPHNKNVFDVKYLNHKLFDVDFRLENIGSYYTAIGETGKKVPGYILGLLELSKKLSNLDLFVTISNLFNKRYALTADSWNGYYPGSPRRVDIGMRITF